MYNDTVLQGPKIMYSLEYTVYSAALMHLQPSECARLTVCMSISSTLKLNQTCLAGCVARTVSSPNYHLLGSEDVVSCCLDLSVPSISFRINGQPVQGMFENFNSDGLFFPVASFSAGVKSVLIANHLHSIINCPCVLKSETLHRVTIIHYYITIKEE